MCVRGSVSCWSSSPSGVPQGSVLGPTLFNIFINDLPSQLKHALCLLFADDLKIYRTIKSNTDCELLQHDLFNIAKWAQDNRMSFNVSKSVVLHIGSNNPHAQYFLNDLQILPKDTVKDLGVLVDNKLKFHQQSAAVAKKALSSAHFIFKSFSFLNPSLFSKLYKVFVRPNFEYCVQSWRPHYKKSIDLLERTQRKITKWCPGLSNLPYEVRLRSLNLPTLSARFDRGDLIETFKILKHHYDIPTESFFSLSSVTRTRGHDLKLILPKCSSDIKKFSFVVRTVQPWNSLLKHIVSSTSIKQWKERFNAYFT